jgi:hypothetical protein
MARAAGGAPSGEAAAVLPQGYGCPKPHVAAHNMPLMGRAPSPMASVMENDTRPCESHSAWHAVGGAGAAT